MANIAILYGDDNKKGGIRAYSHLMGKILKKHAHSVNFMSFASFKSPIYKSPTSGWRELTLTYILGRIADYKSPSYDLIIGNGYYGAFCPHTDITIYHFVYPSYTKHLKVNPLKGIIGGMLERKSGKHTIRISVSHFLAEEVWRYYRYKTIVIPNGIDTNKFYPIESTKLSSLYHKWNIAPDSPLILFVGRWNQRKGADVVEYVASQLPQISIIAILGYNSGKNKSNIPKNIRFLYKLNHEEINELYNLANLILYPSRYEPFGYVTAEGWSAGTPVITTPMGLGYDLKANKLFQNFIITDMNNIREETLKLVKKYLALSQDEQRDIVREGRKFIVENYNLEKWKKNVMNVISFALKMR